MTSSSNNRLTRYGLILFFILIIGYGVFEARGLMIGPTIDVSSDTSRTSSQMVKIEGHAERIASLSMNGTEISVTENGDFSEPYVLAPGVNNIILQAKDKYGNTAEKSVEVVYSPAGGATKPAAGI